MRPRPTATWLAAALALCAPPLRAADPSGRLSVLRSSQIFPVQPAATAAGSGGSSAHLAPGWASVSWSGAYNLSSAAVPPVGGSVSAASNGVISADAQPGGALSLYTAVPFLGPASPEGWDALDFYMRGPDALNVSVFLIPAAGAVGTGGSAVETRGRVAADLMQASLFAPQGGAGGAPASLSDHWALFRINLGELSSSAWQRVTWKNGGGAEAVWFVDQIRLLKFVGY